MILGIDWGEQKIGIAISEGNLAEPLVVIKAKDSDLLFSKVVKLVLDKGPERIIVGVSEALSGKKANDFADKLREHVKCEVLTWDETLSTFDAHEFSIASGVNRTKRNEMEDAFAATVMLQSFIDSN